jgi:arginyl-tRNA synthetase
MATFKRELARATLPALPAEAGLDEARIEAALTLPQHADHGDFSFPCFPLAKALRKPPAAIAEELARTLPPPPGFTRVEALSGYLNFFADKALFTQRVVTEVLSRGAAYGDSTEGAGKPVVIDFSSPNMGKELAFHHLRGTMIGNSLSRVFAKLGHPVTRVNHLGDWGTSYGKLIVMFVREGLGEADLEGLTLERLNGLYKAFSKAAEAEPELENAAREAFAKLEAGDAYYRLLWNAFREVTLVELRRLYAILNVDFDSWIGEAFFADRLQPVLDLLQAKGILSTSQGAEVVDLEAHGMPPALIRKSDGSTLYITRDLAAALYRWETYAFSRSFYVVDNGQSLHFQQLFKVLELLGCAWHDRNEHIPFGLVLHKSDEGNWEKGKTRSGHASLLKDVLEAATDKIAGIMAEKSPESAGDRTLALRIAVGALVFSELKNRRLNDIRFEWDQALSFEGDSGPYVQNAHVRLCSILRKAGQPLDGFEAAELEGARWNVFDNADAFAVADLLAQYPERLANAAFSLDPCSLAQYALSLADATHRFLHSNRILGSDEQRERLLLVRAAKAVLGQALEMVGVPAIERM